MSPFKTRRTFEWNNEEGNTRRYPAEILAETYNAYIDHTIQSRYYYVLIIQLVQISWH